MTVYVIVCSGQYTETIDEKPTTAYAAEAVSAFRSYENALKAMEAPLKPKQPERWTEPGFGICTVELED